MEDLNKNNRWQRLNETLDAMLELADLDFAGEYEAREQARREKLAAKRLARRLEKSRGEKVFFVFVKTKNEGFKALIKCPKTKENVRKLMHILKNEGQTLQNLLDEGVKK